MYLSYRWLFFYPRHTGHYAIFHFLWRMRIKACYLRPRNLYIIPLNRRPNIPYIRPLNTQSKQCNCCQKQKETTWGLKITVIAFHDLLCVYSLASGASGRKAKIHHGKVIIVVHVRGSVSRLVAHVCWLDIFMVSCYGIDWNGEGNTTAVRTGAATSDCHAVVSRSIQDTFNWEKLQIDAKWCGKLQENAQSYEKMLKIAKFWNRPKV